MSRVEPWISITENEVQNLLDVELNLQLGLPRVLDWYDLFLNGRLDAN